MASTQFIALWLRKVEQERSRSGSTPSSLRNYVSASLPGTESRTFKVLPEKLLKARSVCDIQRNAAAR